MASSSNHRMLSAEERKRQRELEEARKAGLAAPEVDEDGNAINPHIPQFMASAPWYLNNDRPSLRHQRDWRDKARDEGGWYDRGATTGRATTYRKGACANCGSATHATKDCVERPRARGARWTGRDIAPDEKVGDVKMATFDAKRDRWNGFEAGDWERISGGAERVAALREARAREHALREGEEDEEGVAGDRVGDADAADFGRVERRVRTIGGGATGSVRNLRIREDTAKYLLNLDPNSAYYDPKSRSMREDPFAGQGASAASRSAFRGDNASRGAGDAAEVARVAAFAATAFEAGGDVHANAAPSAAETAYQRAQRRAAAAAAERAKAVREAYGDAAAPDDDPLRAVAASEAYAEWDASGRLLKGVARRQASSRYEEDVHPGNHTSVFGSYWLGGRWGYACCHSLDRGSYCTGEAGRKAADENTRDLEVRARAAEERRRSAGRLALEAAAGRGKGTAASATGGGAAAGAPAAPSPDPTSQLWGSDAVGAGAELDEARVREAVERTRKRVRAEGGATTDEARGARVRGAAAAEASRDDGTVTAEDIEAYRMTRGRADDPLDDINRLKDEKGEGGAGERVGGYDYV